MAQQTARPKIGLRRKAAAMLSLAWPDSSVSRATIRAALPPGDVGHLALRGFLSGFAYKHDLAIGGRYFIRVLEPDRLREYAFRDMPPVTGLYDFVHIPTVTDTIRRQLPCQGNMAIRRRRLAEVEFLESLW